MKKLMVIVAVLMAVGILLAIISPSEYETRTRAEYRQMVSEGK